MSDQHKVIETLADIPAGNYQGYFWLSDQREPNIVDGTLPDLSPYETASGPANPFVVEANFFSKSDNVSISVRHIDGAYRIDEINWQNGMETSDREFLAHSSFGDKKLRMRTAWIPETDKLCEDMEVLTPAWSGFVGFAREMETK